MADAQPVQGLSRTPADFLKSIKGKPVIVKLNSGVDYRGVLACLDGYMNIAMEQTEEYVNGQLKNKYGDAFIRGNNGALVMEAGGGKQQGWQRCVGAYVLCVPLQPPFELQLIKPPPSHSSCIARMCDALLPRSPVHQHRQAVGGAAALKCKNDQTHTSISEQGSRSAL